MKIRLLSYFVFFVFSITTIVTIVFLIRVNELRGIDSIEISELDYGENYKVNFSGLVADSLSFKPSIFVNEIYVRNDKDEIIAHFENVELFFGFINLLLGNGIVSKLNIDDMSIHLQYFYPFIKSVFHTKEKLHGFETMNWKLEFDQTFISNLNILPNDTSLRDNDQKYIIPKFNNVNLNLSGDDLDFEGQIWQGQKAISSSGRIYNLADIPQSNSMELSFEISSGAGLFNGKLNIGNLSMLDQISAQIEVDSQNFFKGLISNDKKIQKAIDWLAKLDSTKGSLSIDGKWPHLRLVTSNLTTQIWSDFSIVTEGKIDDLFLLSDVSFGFVVKLADTRKFLPNIDTSNNNLLKLLFSNNSLNLTGAIDGDLAKGFLVEIFEIQTKEGSFAARLAFDGNLENPVINFNLSSEEVMIDPSFSEVTETFLSNLLTKPVEISTDSEVYGNVRINKLKLDGLSDVKDLSLDLVYKNNIITGGLANFLIYDGSFRGFISKDKGRQISHKLYLKGSRINLGDLQRDLFKTESITAKGDIILSSKNSAGSNFYQNWKGSLLIYDGKLSLFKADQVPNNDIYKKLVAQNVDIKKFNCGFVTFESSNSEIDYDYYLEGNSINLLVNGAYSNSSKIVKQQLKLQLTDLSNKNNAKYYPLSFVKNLNDGSLFLENSGIIVNSNIYNHNLKQLTVNFPKKSYPRYLNFISDDFKCLIFDKLNFKQSKDKFVEPSKDNSIGLQISTFSNNLNSEIQKAMQYLNPEYNQAQVEVRIKTLKSRRDGLIDLFF